MLNRTETDEELMALYQEGSEEAFRALYIRHSGKILGYLRARTMSQAEATDLFQEVFIKIHKSKHLYNRTLPVLPWIFSITHSVLLDGKRSNARKKEVFDYNFDLVEAPTSETSAVESVIPVISKLPDNQSVALQMRYVDEKTFDEIASALKTSPLNVRQIVSRGIKNLRRFIKEGEKP